MPLLCVILYKYSLGIRGPCLPLHLSAFQATCEDLFVPTCGFCGSTHVCSACMPECLPESAYQVAYVLVNKVCLICQGLLTFFLLSWSPLTLLHSRHQSLNLRPFMWCELYPPIAKCLWTLIKHFPRKRDAIQKQYLYLLPFLPSAKIVFSVTNICETSLTEVRRDWDCVTVVHR